MSKEKIVEKLRGLGHVPEAKDSDKKEDEKKEDVNASSKIKTLLQNNIWNHAGIMDKLWKDEGGSNASNRSKFRKKLEGEESEDGSKYHFTDEEAARIMGILSSAASSVIQRSTTRDKE